MTKESYITLRDLAKKFNMSPSAIYNYIQKGLLPNPKRIPNTKKGRGTLAVYPHSIIKRVEMIQARLKEVHSLEQLKKEFALTEPKRQKSIINKLKKMIALADEGKIKSDEFEKGLRDVANLSKATATTGTNVSIEPSSLKE